MRTFANAGSPTNRRDSRTLLRGPYQTIESHTDMMQQQAQREIKDQTGQADTDCVLTVERRFDEDNSRIVTVRHDGDVQGVWTSHRTRDEIPHFPGGSGAFDRIIAHDVLEYVLDEEAWIAALADLLGADGRISIRVPLEGPLAWLDARNIYRYVADLTERGTAPAETKPTGWHRHYRERDLDRMLRRFGLRIVSRQREGLPGLDIPHVAGLVIGDLALGRSDTESRLVALRDRLDPWVLQVRAGALSTHLRIEARKDVD